MSVTHCTTSTIHETYHCFNSDISRSHKHHNDSYINIPYQFTEQSYCGFVAREGILYILFKCLLQSGA